ncbi:bifunctional glutamate N-acetyltransferase/amino-acid acetyltransferase ArgJ [Zhongshania sp.]|jgi:glutamate N-acetyltransferase/amino-acid N-acetyltransferase|uniref:bifunctional glutamate N-acetyltransferase/amino-acid acetyltransferase ArgJ n=1 Tax=Zhongshania sp. TaxID=1971902 RepID=UPI001B556718|nr:bifunctional glutamate N-acetyltransferase/amino-acid acetyltransferase ArgJ [Zhongshania sp.]MBQ0797293.1 bifunctional glutamate N-acetyltransferase/amino-acid acetyltransferase ArgJ [Zhongshania sp.]
MAVGSGDLGTLHSVDGVRIGVASAGIKKVGRIDTVVFELAEGSSVAGVFTLNAFCAAPVTVAKKHLAADSPRYLLINTGNANAGTGAIGMADAHASCAALAEQVGVAPEQILPFSTGVIGEKLPLDKLVAAMPAAVTALSADAWERAANGIMTTDTRPKATSRQIEIDGRTITVTGISKGAGMIKPNMATMLGYVATDAAIAPDVLQAMLDVAADASFNRITIDGDTSTNDSCVLVATGKAGGEVLSVSEGQTFEKLQTVFNEVFLELAHAIVRDGEGATKFVAVEVAGAKDVSESLKVAYAVAESPLVKTALFASDPNWGRILAAIGRAGVEALDVSILTVHLDEVLITEHGGRAASYTEAAGAAVMKQSEITIRINLNRGQHTETVWTTDFSYDYVKINAEYRS